MHLLVCDDDIQMCEHIAKRLSRRIDVSVAHSKQQALSISNESKIDILIVDYFLNDGNGLDLVSEVKKKHQSLKTILISGVATKEIAIRSISLNINLLIEKPFSGSDLEHAVEGFIQQIPSNTEKNIKFHLNARDLTAAINEISFSLTPIEYKILHLLSQNTERRLSRAEISKHIWADQVVSENSFDTHLGNIKRKMGPYCYLLTNVKGVGYTLDL